MLRTVIANLLERAGSGIVVLGSRVQELADRIDPLKITIIPDPEDQAWHHGFRW